MCGFLSASILASSCTSVTGEDGAYGYTPYEPQDASIGPNAVSLSLAYNEEDANYINALVKLSNDIISNPEVAKKAIQDREHVLSRYGYNNSLKLDESLTKIVLALGDKEINDALKSGDYVRLYSLLDQKDLLTDTQKCLLNTPQYQKQLKSINEKFNLNLGTRATRTAANNDAQLQLAGVVPVAAVVVIVSVAIAFLGVIAYGITEVSGPSVVQKNDFDISAFDAVCLKDKAAMIEVNKVEGHNIIQGLEDGGFIDEAKASSVNNLIDHMTITEK